MTYANHSRTSRPLKIYLGDLTYTTLSLATDAFPLNVGFIAAYASKIFGTEIDVQLFKYVDDLEQAIQDSPPDILGVSNYPWNFNLGLEFSNGQGSLSKDNLRHGRPEYPARR